MASTVPADGVPKRRSPERIGRYDVIERIGRGAMGVVYRAHDSAVGRDVALKVLTADLEDDPDIRARFHREAEAAAQLSHPNIITIFDVGEDADRFFIVMELLHGATLKDFLKQTESVGIGRKLDLMVQACAGLRAAHNASIYHRDIKPGNLFIRSDGLLKILDFGVARIASSSMTASGFIVGTPDYMSPEQARGDEIDHRSDIFSLGAVFYFILTGRKPFSATQLPSLFRQIQSEDPTPLAATEAPPALEAIIRKAMSKSADARQQSCDELLADLKVLSAAHPSEPAPRPSESQNRATPEPDGPSADDSNSRSSGSSTDETVDSLPVGMFDGDDTVQLRPPTWIGRMRDLVDTAVFNVFARLRAQSPSRQTGVRKR